MQCIMPQHFFCCRKLKGRLFLRVLLGLLLLVFVLLRIQFLVFHGSSGLLEPDGEGLARTMEFSSDGIRSLLGQETDLFVAQLFIGHQQEQEPVLLG
jgi:hypothetical protein